MTKFISKRLQIFISSTFVDLIEERQAAVEAVLTAGHIPAGMELFTSGDESQMTVIEQWIDESDVYLLILGGRYGSIEEKSGKSYTHLEYEYAVSKGKPLFACVVNEPSLEERVKVRGSEILEKENPKKLKDFRAEVTTRMVRFWDDAKDIKITIGETLSHLSRQEELVGWVRPGDAVDAGFLAEEIARLSKENSELRAQLLVHGQTVIHGLSAEQMHELLKEKNIVDTMVSKRLEFTNGYWVDSPSEYEELTELESLGLLNFLDDRYRLTDEGRAYLNWYQSKNISSREA